MEEDGKGWGERERIMADIKMIAKRKREKERAKGYRNRQEGTLLTQTGVTGQEV